MFGYTAVAVVYRSSFIDAFIICYVTFKADVAFDHYAGLLFYLVSFYRQYICM